MVGEYMKIRNGFVSNSSSSSFLINLSSIPTTMEQLKEMLLGEDAPIFLTLYDNDAFPTVN
jgi:hypothetical protein